MSRLMFQPLLRDDNWRGYGDDCDGGSVSRPCRRFFQSTASGAEFIWVDDSSCADASLRVARGVVCPRFSDWVAPAIHRTGRRRGVGYERGEANEASMFIVFQLRMVDGTSSL